MSKPRSHLRKGIILAALLLLAGSVALAAEPLTWDACVKQAVRQNPDLRSAEETLSSTGYQADAAYSNFLPQATGSMGYIKGTTPQSSGGGGGGGGGSSGYTASLNFSQNVFNGMQDVGKVTQGKANRDASKATLDITKAQVSFDLKNAFSNLLYAQDYEELAARIIERRAENANMVQLRFDGGIENKGSLLLAKSFLSQSKYDKLVAHHDIEVSREQLGRVLGMEDAQELRIAGKVPLSDAGKEPDFKKLVAELPVHQQAVAQERASKAGVTIARGQFFPSVNVTGGVARQGPDWFPPSGRDFVGANMSLPIFNGALNYFNFKSAAATSAASSSSRESVDRLAIPQLRQAWRAYAEAIEKLKVDREFLEAATVRAEIARAKYQNGLLSFEDWDIIEDDLITKQKTALQSELNVSLAEAAWRQVQGKGSIP